MCVEGMRPILSSRVKPLYQPGCTYKGMSASRFAFQKAHYRHDCKYLDRFWIHVKLLELGKAELISLTRLIIMDSLDPEGACRRKEQGCETSGETGADRKRTNKTYQRGAWVDLRWQVPSAADQQVPCP
jgi:hypothetical protein